MVYMQLSRPWMGYIRVSAVGGRGGDRFRSPGDQRATIQSWADRHGFEVEFREELDRSGGDSGRPVLNEIVRGIEAGTHQGLVVAYLSRLARNTAHVLDLSERLEKVGAKVVSVAEDLDITTPSGRLTRTMIAALNEMELDIYRESFAALRASTVAGGIWAGRQVPLGYVKDPETRRLTPHPLKADLVRQTFAKRAAGATLAELGRDVGMTVSGVKRMLQNPVYLGQLGRPRSDNKPAPINSAAHEPLIGYELFRAVQGQIGQKRNDSQYTDVAALSKVIRCGSCAGLMSRGGSPGTSRGVVYTCQTNGPCRHRAVVRLGRVERYVRRVLQSEVGEIVAARDNEGDVAMLRDEFARAEDELAAFLDNVKASDMDRQVFQNAVSSRVRDVDQARAKLHAATQQVEVSLDIRELWPTFTSGEQNEILRSMFEAVVVWPSGGKTVPIENRVQVWRVGADLVPKEDPRGGEQRRPVVSLGRLDGDDPRLAGTRLHDAG
jgi:DNA invertase Pin-like site-specific DNA recombinase